ncbi:hypothetical protein AMECASPLE_005673 [Ameca splendens]|uniref:Uncharacterized protein n=1 Tax=Ameca splendens TaxID=208324 RepID=A0ABV1A6A9_9TELE
MTKKQVMHQSVMETALSSKERDYMSFQMMTFFCRSSSNPLLCAACRVYQGEAVMSTKKVAYSSLLCDRSLTQQKPASCCCRHSIMQFNAEQCRQGLSAPTKLSAVALLFSLISPTHQHPTFNTS